MDTIAEMLISIKNANAAAKPSVSVPHSNLRQSIAECLMKNGYVASVSKKTSEGGKPFLEITLSYEGKDPKIAHVERVSKPSRRIYTKAKEIRRVKNGKGLLVVSTPKGGLAGRKKRIGRR
jgi:small subunit ribosomal protein S8